MTPQEKQKILDTLVNLGVCIEENNLVSFTDKFLKQRIEKTKSLSLKNPKWGKHIKEFLAGHTQDEQISFFKTTDFYLQAAALLVVERAGGTIKATEAENLVKMISIIDKLQGGV